MSCANQNTLINKMKKKKNCYKKEILFINIVSRFSSQ